MARNCSVVRPIEFSKDDVGGTVFAGRHATPKLGTGSESSKDFEQVHAAASIFDLPHPPHADAAVASGRGFARADLRRRRFVEEEQLPRYARRSSSIETPSRRAAQRGTRRRTRSAALPPPDRRSQPNR